MKHLFFVILSSVFFIGVSAQVINVPDKAQKHLQEKYPGATNVKWSNNVANYDANFKMEGVACKAHYNVDGTWDFTEKFIKKEDAPQAVKDSYSKSTYRDNTIKSFAFAKIAR
jgi:N-acetylmuramoyl-L-alanine amidase CwlA